MTTHPFDKIDLLNYATGSCPPAKSDAIRSHCETCVSCRAYVEAQRQEQERFLAAHPLVESTLPRRPPRKIFRFPEPARMYAIAASLLLCIGGMYMYTTSLSKYGYRVKGEPKLTTYVQTEDGSIERRSSNIFFPGERIQFSYSCGPERWLVLLSIDTSGAMSLYYPSSGDSSIALELGRDIPLPQSIMLDNYIGPELFIAVFSPSPMPVSTVKRAVTDAFILNRSLESLRISIPHARVVQFHCVVQERGSP